MILLRSSPVLALNERTVVQALRKATDRLESSGVLRPGWNAEQLLAKQLGCAPLSLYVDPPSIDPKQWIGFESDVACRAGGMPLQYLLGSAEFFGREFQVGPGVFIPRPETEVLLEVALKILDQGGPADGKTDPNDSSLNAPVVVDVGTGCGTIAITLDLEKPGLSLYALERSRIALSFAIRNARRYEARVRFLEGDLICAFSSACVDLIVANLPYLDPAESAHWPVELHWEPWLALDGGKQGLASIQWLMAQTSKVLKPDGTLLLEIAPGQVVPLKQIAQRTGWSVAHVILDLAGSERVMVLKWKS